MKPRISTLRGFVILALSLSLILFPTNSFAVVNDVTLTGLPPNTTVSLTNETTGEIEEAKTDDNGVVFFPLIRIGRKWDAGTCTVTVKEPDGRTISEKLTLKDGPNRIDLSHIARTTQPKTEPKKDVRLSDPIKVTLPETTVAETAGAVAKGLLGGMLGGLFGGGRQEGPNLAGKPPYPVQTFTSKDGKTKCDLSGAVDDTNPQIAVRVEESPGNGAPHLVVLQDNKGNILQPTQIQVYEIWELWGGWRLTVSWTKSYYTDGRLVKQERGGWSTSWTGLLDRYKSPSEIPAIWQDFGGKAFESIRGIIADFQLPEGQTFNPADWNLVAHVTTKGAEPNTIVTQPFVAAMSKNEKGILTFMQRERTVWETAAR